MDGHMRMCTKHCGYGLKGASYIVKEGITPKSDGINDVFLMKYQCEDWGYHFIKNAYRPSLHVTTLNGGTKP